MYILRGLICVCDGVYRLSKKRKKGKKIKDPNKPKRPPSPFFAFMYVGNVAIFFLIN